MVPEARIEVTETGHVPVGEGWFILNAKDARLLHRETRGARLDFDGEAEFPQVGINLFVLEPGEPMGTCHCEADQEDFLVLSGEARKTAEAEEAYAHLPGREPTRYRDGWLPAREGRPPMNRSS